MENLVVMGRKFNNQKLLDDYCKKYSVIPIAPETSFIHLQLQKQQLINEMKQASFISSKRAWRRNRHLFKHKLNYLQLLLGEHDYDQLQQLGLL